MKTEAKQHSQGRQGPAGSPGDLAWLRASPHLVADLASSVGGRALSPSSLTQGLFPLHTDACGCRRQTARACTPAARLHALLTAQPIQGIKPQLPRL